MYKKKHVWQKDKVMKVLLFYLFTFLTLSAQTYSLEQLKDSALQNNVAVRNARYGIEAARQQRREAFTKYFPTVSGSGLCFNANKGMAQTSFTPSEMIPAELGTTLTQMMPAEALASLASPVNISMLKNGTIAGITAVQPVFAGGQIINGNKLAKVGEDVSRLQLQMSENEVERTTEQYYWQVVSLEEKMKTVAAVENMLDDIRKDVEVAVRAGVAMRNDLLQVQLRQNEVESQKLKLKNGVSIVRMLLAQYCGLHTTVFTLRHADEAPSPDALKRDHDQALLTTTEYQLLGKQVEAARLQKRLTLGQQLPTVAVGAGYNYHNLMENNHTFGMLFATVSVPISDWWGGSHAIKRRQIAYRQAVDEQCDKSDLLRIRMENCWNSVEESYQQLAIAQRSIEQAEENLRLNRDYYKAGTSKMSDLLEAQLLYQQSLDSRTDAFIDYHTNILKYRQATGQ